MSLIKRRHGRWAKTVGLAAIAMSAIFLPIEFYFMYIFWGVPRATNCFFHFNFQYLAGNEATEKIIIEEPYFKLLQMLDKHPSWNFTVELQAVMIERILNTPEYEDILNLTRKLNERGQMEIICALYSAQLIHPYPQEAVEWSFKHAYQIMEAANLTRSRVLLCQEGQVDMGIVNILNSNWSSGIDTLIVPWQVIHGFAPLGHTPPASPIYVVDNLVPTKSMYFIVYDYLPRVEADFMHSWTFCMDGELAFQDPDAEERFAVDDARLRSFEKQWAQLERLGNRFYTVEQWVDYCVTRGSVKTLDFYIPETHWGPTKYNSSQVWMGLNKNCDDGEMIANNRRGFFTVQATEILYNSFIDRISTANRSTIENLLNHAEKSVVLAMASDTTGINPAWYERYYGELQVYQAIENCSTAISILISEIPGLNVNSTFQVDLLTRAIENNTNNFKSPTIHNMLSLSALPISIQTKTTPTAPSYTPISSLQNTSFEGMFYKSLYITFPGTWNWTINQPTQIEIVFNLTSSSITYCPSLTDSANLTQNISRSNYASDPIHIYLPISNGLIFLPETPHSTTGLAIINNCSSRHTSINLENDYFRFIEIGGIHMNATYHLLLLEDIELHEAVTFAQRVNNKPLWCVSDNISNISGYSVYDTYKQVANATYGAPHYW